jgi:hypothetical protein
MSKLTTFISMERLKSVEFGFDNNIEPAYVIPNIIKGQKFLIKPLLGEIKYNQMLDYVESLKTGATINPTYDMLIDDYIAPALAYYVKSEIVFNTAYKMKNSDKEGSGDRFKELVNISKKYLSDSDAFLNMLKEYMCDNGIPQDEPLKIKGCGIFLGRRKPTSNLQNNKPAKNY